MKVNNQQADGHTPLAGYPWKALHYPLGFGLSLGSGVLQPQVSHMGLVLLSNLDAWSGLDCIQRDQRLR